MMSEAVSVSESVSESADRRSAAPGAKLSFDEFVAARSSALWRSAYLLTGDPQKAEDLLQTALMEVWRRWPKIAADGAVEGYIRRVLVTTYTDWRRRKWVAEYPSDVVPDHAGGSGLDGAELREDVLRALSTLTRGQRAVVVLRYFDDLTEAQTAHALGCSVGTVKSQASRAMQALRSSPFLSEGTPAEEEES